MKKAIGNKMGYCRDAQKLLKIKVVCGKDCPIYPNCPRLILQNANDEADEINNKAIEEAIKAMIRSYTNGKKSKININ